MEAFGIAGVGSFDLNCWRHRRASEWVEEKTPLMELQSKLGHSKPATTSMSAKDSKNNPPLFPSKVQAAKTRRLSFFSLTILFYLKKAA